jgi:hypothetical protein
MLAMICIRELLAGSNGLKLERSAQQTLYAATVIKHSRVDDRWVVS